MPYINITVTKQISKEEKNTLQLAIVDNIFIIPGKTPAVTTVCINDGCAMFKDREPIDGVFVDIRLYKESTQDSKLEFAQKITTIIEDVLGISKEHLQINYLELADWY